VIAWEPVPQFRALLSYNLAIHKLTELVTVRNTVVADNHGGKQVGVQSHHLFGFQSQWWQSVKPLQQLQEAVECFVQWHT
jgi:hypothetical protein